MSQFFRRLWGSGKGGKAVIIVGVILLLGFFANITTGGARKTAPTPTTGIASGVKTETPRPTSIPGPTETPAPTEPPPPTPRTTGIVGERFELAGLALTVLSVERKDQIGQYSKAKDGSTYVIAEVVIENTGYDSTPYNLLYFEVKDSDGFEYNAAVVLGTDTPMIQSGDLTLGDKARGIVVFEVKKEATGLVLKYEPLVIGGEYEPIKVALDL